MESGLQSYMRERERKTRADEQQSVVVGNSNVLEQILARGKGSRVQIASTTKVDIIVVLFRCLSPQISD